MSSRSSRTRSPERSLSRDCRSPSRRSPVRRSPSRRSPGHRYPSRRSPGRHSPRQSPNRQIGNTTNDPKLKNCRIFVGNITSQRFCQAEIQERFSVYGKILGISIHKGFSFVQFETPSSAEEAIKKEDRTMFKGTRIDVRTATTTSEDSGPGRINGRGRGQRSVSPPRHHSSMRERSPVRRDREYFDDRYRDPYKRESRGDDRYAESSRYSFNEREPPSRGHYDEEFFPREPYRDDVLDPNRPNDCEIIVVVKHLRAYGESVERRLKNLGLTVDLLFLKDEAALLPTIDDIARRGSLFAVVIADQNETHRSVTLNILHGTPQEHRNMPLDDAMKLVALNYHEYVQTLRDKKMKGVQVQVPGENRPVTSFAAIGATSVTSAASVPAPHGRSPKLQNLLTLLVEGKYLTAAELEVVITYLQEQRSEVLARERGDHLQDKVMGAPADSPGLDYPRSGGMRANEENNARRVQQSIPGIDQVQSSTNRDWPYDNSKSPAVSQVPAVAPPQDQSQQQANTRSSGSFLNFDNPTVQRALDSLIQSGPNLLQSVFGNTREGSNPPKEDQRGMQIPTSASQDSKISPSRRSNQMNSTGYPSGNHMQQQQQQQPGSFRGQRPNQYPGGNPGNPGSAPQGRGIRHPLLGTPVSNRFQSPSGMGRGGSMGRPQGRNF